MPSVWVIRTTVGQHLNRYEVSCASLGDSGASCWSVFAGVLYCRCCCFLSSMVQTRSPLITRDTVPSTMLEVPVPPSAWNSCGLRVVPRTRHYLAGVSATLRQTVRPYRVEVEMADRKPTKYLNGFPRASYDNASSAELCVDPHWLYCRWTCCRVVSCILVSIALRNRTLTNIVQWCTDDTTVDIFSTLMRIDCLLRFL